jgi:hypothetical protein
MGSLESYVGSLFELIGKYEQLIRQCPGAQAQVTAMEKLRRRRSDFLQDDVSDLVRESMEGLKRVKILCSRLKTFHMWAKPTGRKRISIRVSTVPEHCLQRNQIQSDSAERIRKTATSEMCDFAD